jgi:hypothetical protein
MVTSKSSVLKEPRLDFTIVTEENLVERVTPNPAREEIEKIELNHDTYALDIETEAITKGALNKLKVTSIQLDHYFYKMSEEKNKKQL